MGKKESAYRKLPGRGAKHNCLSMVIWSRSSLWMGPDHLLSVTNTGYAEEYRRFYFRDIQAISVTRTRRGRNIIIGLLSAALLFFFLSMTVPTAAMPFFWGTSALFAVLALVSWLRGPTTRAFLFTAVSREELPSLGRMKNAEKALDLLKPLIEKEQGRLTALELKEMPEPEPRQKPEPPKPVFTPMRPAVVEQKAASTVPSSYNGRWHEAFFFLLLLGGLEDIVSLFVRSIALSLFSTLTVLAATGVIIVALVKQQESAMRGWLRISPAVTLGFIWVSYVAGFIVNIAVIVTNPAVARNKLSLFKAASGISPQDHPLLLGYTFFSMAISFALGISGLISVYLYRQAMKDASRKGSDVSPSGSSGQGA